jgi:hypothetical protein
VTLQNYFPQPSLVIWLFCNPAPKTATGAANRWETTNSKPPEPIIMIDKLETLSQQSDHIYYTLFCRCTSLLGHVPATAIMLSPQQACFGFSSSNLTVEDHILSTVGDACNHLTQWSFSSTAYGMLVRAGIPFF